MRLALGFFCCIVIVSAGSPILGDDKMVTGDTVITIPSNAGPALDRIVRIAKENHIPLGIAIGSKDLCSRQLLFDATESLSLGSLVHKFADQMPGYRIAVDNGILHLRAEPLSDSANELLSTKLAYFRPEATTKRD
jgi:hypothetical protein